MQGISDFFSRLLHPYDHYVLFDHYCNHLRSRGLNPSIEGFAEFANLSKETEKVLTLFFNIFALIEFKTVQQFRQIHQVDSSQFPRSMELLNTYARSTAQMISDFLIALRYHLPDIQKGKVTVSSMPLEAGYSWRGKQQAVISSTIAMDYIIQNMSNILMMHPFPIQLSKILGLSGCKLEKTLDKQQVKLHSVLQRVFNFNAAAGPLASEEQAMLLKHGAIVTRSLAARSWIHQIEKWANSYVGKGRIKDPREHFVLGRFVLGFHNSAVEHPSFSHSPSSSSSRTHIHSAKPLKTHLYASFQTYLVYKTIEKLFSLSLTYLNSPSCQLVREEQQGINQILFQDLATLFKSDESVRLDFVFFSALLHSLLLHPKREPSPKLWEIVDGFLPLGRDLNPFERLVALKNLLFSSGDQNLMAFSEMVLGEFILTHYVVELSPSEENRVRLLIWLYEWRTSPKRGTVDFWEIVLIGKMPRRCLNKFLCAVHYAKSIEEAKYAERDFVCLFDLHCLFSKDPHIGLVAEYFKSLRFELKFNEIEASPVQQSKDMLARSLLRKHNIENDHPRYHFFNAYIYFLNNQDVTEFSDYPKERLFQGMLIATPTFLKLHEVMELSEEAKSFLLFRLASASSDELVNCVEEIGRLGRSIQRLSRDPSNPKSSRIEMLKIACTQAGFPQLYENPSNWVDFQMRVITGVERIIGYRIPLSTAILLFFYCPYLPSSNLNLSLVLRVIDDLLAFKESRVEFGKSLFIDPRLLARIDACNIFQDPDISCSTYSYKSGAHNSVVPLLFSSLMAAVQQRILPSILFDHTMVRLAEPLFCSKGVEEAKDIQNFVSPTAGMSFTDQFYLGEWQMIFYMAKWSIIQSEDARYPVFEIAFWPSLYHLNAQRIQLALDVLPEDLSPELFSLFRMMLETIGKDLCDTNWGEWIRFLDRENSEVADGEKDEVALAMCLEVFQYFREAWDQYLKGEFHDQDFGDIKTLESEEEEKLAFYKLNPKLAEGIHSLEAEEKKLALCLLSSPSFTDAWKEYLKGASFDETLAEGIHLLHSEEDRLALCLEVYPSLKKFWETYQEIRQKRERIARALFRFVVDLKIKTIEMYPSLFAKSNDSNHAMIGSQSHIEIDEEIVESTDDDQPSSFVVKEDTLQNGGHSSSSSDRQLKPFNFERNQWSRVVVSLPSCSTPDGYASQSSSVLQPACEAFPTFSIEKLREICKKCRALSVPERFPIFKGEGEEEIGKLILSFFPIGTSVEMAAESSSSSSNSNSGSHSSSTDYQPHQERTRLNEFVAEINLGKRSERSFFKLGPLLDHSRAPYLLNWLIEEVKRKAFLEYPSG